MTQVIINDVTPREQFTAAGGQTVFNTLFTADATTDINVYVRANNVAANDVTQIVNPADYTVTFIGALATTRVTFVAGQTAGDIITIVRNTPSDRENLYINTNFTPSMLNQDFGLLTLIDQQNQMYDTVINPGYNVSATINGVVDKILPILAANQIWAKNNTDTAIIGYDIPPGGIAPADAKYLIQTADLLLPNAQDMSALATGIVKNTTATGVQSISAPISSLDSIGMQADRIAYGTGVNTYALTTLTPYSRGLLTDTTSAAWRTDLGLAIGIDVQAWNANLQSISALGTAANKTIYTTGVNTWAETDITAFGRAMLNVAAANNGVLITDGVGAPSISSTLPAAVQGNITSVGTIVSGTWNGSVIGSAYGGTGINNGASTITLGGSLTTAGAFDSIFTMTGITTVTFPTIGTLATTSQLPVPSAMTRVDDTNVTLTLGGTPATSLLQAVSLTLGWTGQLAVTRGGTGASTVGANGTLAQSNGAIYTFTTATYPSVATAAGTMLRADGTNWLASTSTFADTYAASTLLYSNGANAVTGLATANSATLVTDGTGVPAWTGSMTNGQVLIGSTGVAPVLSTLVATGGITITNAPGSITISGAGGGFSWTEVTGLTQAMAVNNGYVASNAAQVVLTLPVTSIIGDTIKIQGKGAGGWRVAQNAGQLIHFNSSTTTLGVLGYIESTQRYNSVELVCITNTNEWAVNSASGNLTVF